MSGPSEKTKSIVDEEERKRLISEIAKIQDVLNSFKYGLNFEAFADALFRTIDRQTMAINKLEARMNEIVEQMNRLEKRFNEGVKVVVASAAGEGTTIQPTELVISEEKTDEEEPEAPADVEAIRKEIADLEIKIAKLFEKENELSEMAMNDPAGADEYEEKARVAREMRIEMEAKKKELEAKL